MFCNSDFVGTEEVLFQVIPAQPVLAPALACWLRLWSPTWGKREREHHFNFFHLRSVFISSECDLEPESKSHRNVLERLLCFLHFSCSSEETYVPSTAHSV